MVSFDILILTPGRGFLRYNGFMEGITTPSIPKISPAKFLHEVVAELKKVTWPTREETVKLTFIVIVLSFIVGAFIGGLDSLFVKVQALLFK